MADRHGRDAGEGDRGRRTGRERSEPDGPPRVGAQADDYRQRLIDVLSSFDETILEKYVGDEEITVAFKDPGVGRKTMLASLANLEIVG